MVKFESLQSKPECRERSYPLSMELQCRSRVFKLTQEIYLLQLNPRQTWHPTSVYQLLKNAI